MGPFWNNFCRDVGSYGRNGGIIFFLTVLGGICLLIAWAIFQDWVAAHLAGCMMVGSLALSIFVIFRVKHALKKSAGYQIEPLSREEMKRARSKLLGNQTKRRL